MEVGTDESVVAISFDENSTGKTFADTKVRYTWEVMVDGKVHRIEFTNTKTSGKKRIFVDGRLLHEMTVFRSPNFQYSWPIGGHLLSIVPVKADGTDSIFDKVMDRMANSVDCQFELRINGLPFRAFRKKPARVVPVRPVRPVAEHGQVVAYGHPPAASAPDREYLEMRAKVEELQNRPHRPQGIEAPTSSTGRRTSPWEAAASHPAEKPRVTKTSHGDPWKGTTSSPPQRFGDEGEEIGFTTGARAQYAGFTNSAGSSSEDDEAFTSYGTAPVAHAAHAPSQSQAEWPSSGFGQSAWPSAGGAAGAWPSWEASPSTSPFDAPAPPNRPKRQPVPTYAIPWSPQQQPPAAALPKAPAVSPAMVPQASSQATSPAMSQLLPAPSATRLAKNLAQRKALLESIGLGLSRRSSATPQVTSGRSGHFKWPEAQVEDSRPSVASTRQRSSKLLEHRKALLGSIGLATGSLSRRSSRSKERKGSDIIEGTVLASHETWNEAFGESAFPLVQGNVVDSEDEVSEDKILSGQPNGSAQDSHASMTWPGTAKVAESPGFSSGFEAEAAATTLGRFPPSPGFPEASPVKDMPSGSLQWPETTQGFPASGGFPDASAAKESPLPKETSTPSGMQWPGSALPSAEAMAESPAGFPPSPGFPESSAAKESALPKETSTPSGMQWPGSSLPSPEVMAESPAGFPSSPEFPNATAAKETSTPSGMQWPGSALPSAEVMAESPAGFPPSPEFPEASTAKESPLPKEISTPSGMQWPGSALPSAEAMAESPAGFPPSPGFPESSAAKESALPKETSTPSGMQWPGSSLPSPEVMAESPAGFPPSPEFPEASTAKESPLPKETSTPSGMQWPGSALPSAEAMAESPAGFPPSPGFPESSAAKESALPKETSTPSGMQWPGSSLPSPEVMAESRAGFPSSPEFPNASAAKDSTTSGMQWPGSALPSAEVAAAFSGGFPEWPAQESTPGGMQWPDASLTSSKADAGGFPASGSQDGPKEEAGSANGHSEPSDQVPIAAERLPSTKAPPKEPPKEAPKFHDEDEGEVPSWWPKGA